MKNQVCIGLQIGFVHAVNHRQHPAVLSWSPLSVGDEVGEQNNKKLHQQGNAIGLNATKLFHTLSYRQFHVKIQNLQCFPICKVSQKADDCS